jgi:hypothetical protein
MVHPLDGPRLKVVRAREHLHALQRVEGRFFERSPFEITDDFNIETGQHVYRIRVLRDPPIRRFAALVGDCVHNLRSALDHLAWQLSEDASGSNEADTTTQFPIFKTETGYDTRGINQIVRVGPGAATVIRLLQPFHDDLATLHPLWFIRELDNGDKHRKLAVSAAAASGYAHKLHAPKDARGTYHLNLSIEDIRDGEVMAELTVLPPKPQVHVEATFEFRAVLTSPTVPVTRRLFAGSFLSFLSRRADGAINCFEPFYASGQYDDAVVLDDPIRPFHDVPPYDPLEPPERTDEEHASWARDAREQLEAKVDERLDDIDPARLRSALVRAAADGFVIGAEMTTERVLENLDALEGRELDLPEKASDGPSTVKG